MISKYQIAVVVGLLLGPSLAFASSVNPQTFTAGSDTINISLTNGQAFLSFQTDGTTNWNGCSTSTGQPCDGGGDYTAGITDEIGDIGSLTDMLGTFHILIGTNAWKTACEGSDIATCQGTSGYLSDITMVYDTGGGGSNAFIEQLAAATSTFSGTTGIDIGEVIAWSGNNLIKLFIGSGLAVLFLMRGWIVALVVIGAIVYFAYRAFRFFRH